MRSVTLLRCAVALAAVTALAGIGRATQRNDHSFPHGAHERLFPVCQSCHGGIASSDAGSAYPTAADCAQCHDGTRRRRVAWSERVPRPSNLDFSHARHLAADMAAGAGCQTCHALPDTTGRMAVGPAQPELCIRCHEHRAATHLADAATCSRCHVPLGSARAIGAGRIARFPRPEWHGASDFISTHATTAAPADVSCTVCHARETCERCHANAERLPAVSSLPRDARVAALEAGRVPAYPLPPSHSDGSWYLEHGSAARARTESCANCHTQPSCTGCHAGGTGSAGAVVRSLPQPVAGAATGINPALITRAVHTRDVKLQHGRIAAAGQLDCAQCHTRQHCTSCHAAADSRAFHAPNFVERHAADVFAGRGECQACHSTETFCRACHSRAGLAAQDMRSSFHDAQPMWVLSHGQAARRGLDSCASCHRQNDCVRCHSAAGGWGVNPHGPGFTGRGAARSAASCRLCHRVNPTGGN
jgi:predicted CXXCH cytochrome family protein